MILSRARSQRIDHVRVVGLLGRLRCWVCCGVHFDSDDRGGNNQKDVMWKEGIDGFVAEASSEGIHRQVGAVEDRHDVA